MPRSLLLASLSKIFSSKSCSFSTNAGNGAGVLSNNSVQACEEWLHFTPRGWKWSSPCESRCCDHRRQARHDGMQMLDGWPRGLDADKPLCQAPGHSLLISWPHTPQSNSHTSHGRDSKVSSIYWLLVSESETRIKWRKAIEISFHSAASFHISVSYPVCRLKLFPVWTASFS